MKKIFASLMIISGLMLFSVTKMQAQEGFYRVSAGVELALPIGNFSNVSNFGVGATGKAHYKITEEADITGTLGYIHFPLKGGNQYVSGSYGMVPIMFGYRHLFDNGFYAEPQVGLTILSFSTSMPDIGFGGSFSGSSTKAGLGLGGGYEMGDWDLGLRFNILSGAHNIGARVAYNFAL